MGSTRILSVGISSVAVCGVRDAARVLESAVQARGADASTLWCDLDGASTIGEQRRRAREWLADIRHELREERVQAVIVHYSVFTFGPRGIPVFALPLARALSSTTVPVVGFLHEFAYPFGRRGWRGAAQALSHRLALFPIVRSCSALIVTTEQRADWVRHSPWLPQRPIAFVPAFSNLPYVSEPAAGESSAFRIGVFGFGAPGADARLVAESIGLLNEIGGPLEVVLIGSPGSVGLEAESWRAAFGSHGCGSLLRFTGVRPAHEIAREIAAADLMVFPDRAGPDSRRGTLAAVLAMGKPVVAVDGPERWERFMSEMALVVTDPNAEAMAAELVRFRGDPSLRAEQGSRAEAFYRRCMAADVAVERLTAVLSELEPERTSHPRAAEAS